MLTLFGTLAFVYVCVILPFQLLGMWLNRDPTAYHVNDVAYDNDGADAIEQRTANECAMLTRKEK